MDKPEQIRQGLRKLAAEVGPLNTILVQVVSVDEDAKTCVVIDDDIKYYDVRLRPVLNGNECITIYPKVDTWVLIIKIEDDAAYQVISVDEADKITMVVDDMEVELSEGISIKRGADTLKQILTLIVQATQDIMVLYGNNPDYVKLTQALTKINNVFK